MGYGELCSSHFNTYIIMNLLIAILLYLGYAYTPGQVTSPQTATQVQNVNYAKYINDNHFYTVNEEGVVIDVDVNP